MDTFWEQALHQNSAYIFNLSLSRMERVAVTSVPFQIRRRDENDADDEDIDIAEPPEDWQENPAE